MATPIATDRNPGSPFSDQRAELLAHGLSCGLSLSVAAAQAGIAARTAATLRRDPEFVARLGELQTKMATVITMSIPAIAVELEKTAKEARAEQQYKAATDCYRLLLEILVKHPDKLSGLGQALPKGSSERRAELTRRLRGDNPTPIDTTADDEEAAE